MRNPVLPATGVIVLLLMAADSMSAGGSPPAGFVEVGDKFDPANLRSYRAGSLYRLPARVPHFQATGPEGAVVQIESIGPTSTDFIER
jgi:hypothetical protein